MSGETITSRHAQKEQFTTSFEKVGGKVFIAKDDREISQQILQICTSEAAKKIMLWNHPGLTALSPMLSGENRFEIRLNHDELSKEELLESMENVTVGITWTDYAVAETGSLVLLSAPGKSRSVSLLPDTHIAVLPLQRLYSTRVEVFKLLTPQMKHFRSVTLISGPSKTGDIDGKLNVGVHGPKKVFVILTDQE